ncbi:MAG: hypothetical protein HFJ55_00730 [Clostridia bacterium]|nr:hypothetical protein [Clostridia bacterium]
MYKVNYMKEHQGITLIALVVTLIVLLILAGVSIALLLGENGIIIQATQAKENSKEAEAREKLELTLLSAYNEKILNIKYNQNEFLDNIITNEIEGAEVKGDIAVVDGYAYELDRSVPKIGRFLGKSKDLIFPEVEATVELAADAKTAVITITAIEEKKGINKIEIWQAGEKLDEFTYDDLKEEIKKEYTVNQNGKYTIKAYANIMNSKTIDVEGIVATVKFEPNGNEEWKKEHTTKITIQETGDRVVNAKYQWTDSVVEPEEDTFTKNFKSGDTITENEVTGKYYLWTMIETKSGQKTKWRSEAFFFDNEGPNITSFTSEKYSEDGIILSATAQDVGLGTVKFEFYVDEVLKDTQTFTATTSKVTKNKTITGLTTGSHNCKVIVYDAKNNTSDKTITGTTKLYAWEKWEAVCQNRYIEERTVISSNVIHQNASNWTGSYRYTFDAKNGSFTLSATETHSGPGTYYTGGGRSVRQYIRNNVDHFGTYSVTTAKIEAVLNPNPTFSKGTTKYNTVTDESSTAYPNDGYQDGYYYVKTTSQ